MKRLAWLALAVLGCERGAPAPSPAPTAAAATTAPAAASASAAPSVASAAATASAEPVRKGADRPACRVLTVTGAVRRGAAPVAMGAMLLPDDWIELEHGAEASVRHVQTGREITLLGPGRAAPCWRGEETVLLDAAAAKTSAGAGARPGAEALIATAAGSVRWGDATLTARPGHASLSVEVEGGQAWPIPAAGEPPDTPARSIGAGRKVTLKALAKELDAEQRVQACERAADHAQELAAGVLATSKNRQQLGERAAAHVRARRAARVACASAAAAAGPPPAGRDLTTRIRAADARWQGVPGGRDPAEK